MSPEERQLLQGLFDRMRPNANNPRDREAEQLIADNMRQQPYAAYLLSQTVIVQDQALQAANQRLQQLEQENQSLQSRASAQPSGGGGFLSGLFGGGQSNQAPPPRPPVWNQGGAQQGYPQQGYPQQGGGYPQQGGYAPQPQQGGPWGGQPAAPQGGGGFLHGALGAAAGVAGGVLLADSMRGLFGGHNDSLGISSGMGGLGGGMGGLGGGMGGLGGGTGGGETVVNNYYGDQSGGDATNADYQQDADQDQDAAQDASDDQSYDT